MSKLSKYRIVCVLREDRGIIPTTNSTSKVGIIPTGRHIPYDVGLVVQNISSWNLELLDIYNSERLLSCYIGESETYGLKLPHLIKRFTVYTNSVIPVKTVQDHALYLKENHIRVAPRDDLRMKSLSTRLSF